MSFFDEIGTKLVNLEKSKVAAKEPEFTPIEAKIVKFCTEPRVSSSIIELFPARPHNVLGIIQSLVKKGILLSCTNKYVANLEHRDFNVVMTMTANKKKADDEYKEKLRRKFHPYYDAQNYVVYKLPFKGNTIEDVLSIEDKDVQELIHDTLHSYDYVETSDGNTFSVGEIWEHTDEPERSRFRWEPSELYQKNADTSSDIAITWENADDLQREELLKAVNITSDYIRQYSAIDSFDLLPIWLQDALAYEKKASILPTDETLWKNEIKDTVANLKADNITFKDAQEMTDYLVGDKGDLTTEQKEYAGQLYNESANTVAEKKKAHKLSEFEKVVAELIADNMYDYAWGASYGEQYAIKDAAQALGIKLKSVEFDTFKVYTEVYNILKTTPKGLSVVDAYLEDFVNAGIYDERASNKKADLDPISADELFLYTENDGQLYERVFMPIIKNLTKKKKNNIYDSELAVKAFAYLAEEGAKKYAKDFGGTWNTMFDVPTRKQVATYFRDKFESLYENKEYDFMADSKQASAKKMYAEIVIKPHYGGFNMYDVDANAPDYEWEDYTDIVTLWEEEGYDVYNLTDDGVPEEMEDIIEDITGRIYNEPETVYALVQGGEVTYSGIDSIDIDEKKEASKKKASAYTDFVGKYMKENKGSSIGDAAKAWKSQKGNSDDKAKEPKTDVKEDKSIKTKKDTTKDKEKDVVKDKVEKKADTSGIKVIDINDASEEQATNFYEYPSFKIFDDEHAYLVAEYQLIIENGIKYVVTDDVPTINNKVHDGSLELDWETSAYNFDIREKKADYEEEEFEEEFNEPEDGDYVMSDSGGLGSMTSVSIVGGGSKGFLGEFEDDDSAMIAIKEHMEEEHFWPNVWYQDDHGGLSIRTASVKTADTSYEIGDLVKSTNPIGRGKILRVLQVNPEEKTVEVFFNQEHWVFPFEDVVLYQKAPMKISIKTASPEVSVGDVVKIDMNIVKKHDNMPPYIRLVNQAIKNAENGMPYVAEVDDHFVYIRAWQFDLLGDVRIPKEAIISSKKASVKKAAKGYSFSVVNTDGFEDSVIKVLSPFGQVNYEEEEDGGLVLEIGVLDVPSDKLIAFAKTVESLGADIWSVAMGNWGVFAENHDDLTPTEFVTQILGAKEASVKKADFLVEGYEKYKGFYIDKNRFIIDDVQGIIPKYLVYGAEKVGDATYIVYTSESFDDAKVWVDEHLNDETYPEVPHHEDPSAWIPKRTKKADDEKTVTEVVNVPRKISPLEKTKDIPREEYIVAKEANDTLKDLYKSVMELSSQIAMDEEEIKRVAAEMKKTKEIDPSKALLQESIEKLTLMLAESDKIVTINAEKVLKLVEKSSEEPVLSETVLAKLDEMRERHRQIEEDYIKSAGAQMKEIKRTITQELKVIPLRANKTAISFKEIFNKIKNFFTGWLSDAKDFGKELDTITW